MMTDVAPTIISETVPAENGKETAKIPETVKLPNICKVCVCRKSLSANTTKASFQGKLSSLSQEDFQFNSFSYIVSDKTVTADLWSKPENCCYLCTGLLQEPTLSALSGRCREILAEYTGAKFLTITCASLHLLQVRSFLAGVPHKGLAVKTVFKWLLGDILCSEHGLTPQSQELEALGAVTVSVDVRIPQDEFLWTAREPRKWPVYNFTTGLFKQASLEKELARAKAEDCRGEMVVPGGAAVKLDLTITSLSTFVGQCVDMFLITCCLSLEPPPHQSTGKIKAIF